MLIIPNNKVNDIFFVEYMADQHATAATRNTDGKNRPCTIHCLLTLGLIISWWISSRGQHNSFGTCMLQ